MRQNLKVIGLTVLLTLYALLALAFAQTLNPAKQILLNPLQNSSPLSDNAISDPALPPPEQAYILSISARDNATLQATWTIDPCCYMYRERFGFRSQTPGIELGTPQFPPGLEYEDEFYGKTEIYRDKLVVLIPYQRTSATLNELELLIDFQGCADIGVCYPPQQQTVPVILPAALSPEPTDTLSRFSPLASPSNTPQVYVSEQDYIADTLVQQRFWALPLFFGFGLLLAFTPCVFPMIPILSGIIAGQRQLTQRHAFRLSLVYVLAMALTYTAVGIGAALLGANVQIWFQQPWVLIAFSALFVALALSMFGLYELQLPTRWQSHLAELSRRQSSGRYTGVAGMGVLSALIVGPCVAAPLIGILSVISITGDVVLGGTALFIMSLGMGTPLLLIGTSAGKLLPKAGPWMSLIKAAFGIMMLGVAIWLLERILPQALTLVLWSVLLIVTATFMRSIKQGKLALLGKGLGTTIMVYGIALAVGAVSGGKDPLQPLRGSAFDSVSNRPSVSRELAFTRIKTINDLVIIR